VLEQKVKLEYVRTDENEADGFTKGLGTVRFENNMGWLWVRRMLNEGECRIQDCMH
jgi:hypothetical protein